MSQSKYILFGQYLSKLHENIVTITFDEFIKICNLDQLPPSAYKHEEWWANDYTHSNARYGWLAVGWKVSKKDVVGQKITFERADTNTQIDESANKVMGDKPAIEDFDTEDNSMDGKSFEEFARTRMSQHFNLTSPLQPNTLPNIPKKFDFVSSDNSIVGDAKYYTMVQGTKLPPAKFATIAEYVWFLEKTDAKIKFLVFGNDITVPTEWIKRYGHLVKNIRFYFLSSSGELKELV